MMNELNWTSSYFKNEHLRCFLALGAKPDGNEVVLEYCLTLTDHDYNEVFQKNFLDLSKAIETINKDYADWEFIRSGKIKDGSCGSCTAH